VRINFVYGVNDDESPTLARQRIRSNFEEPELATDSTVPAQQMSTQALKKSLQLARLTTLANWGFEVRQHTPNHYGIDALLERFNYWKDDIEHIDFFG
jgi:hypothetical protein